MGKPLGKPLFWGKTIVELYGLARRMEYGGICKHTAAEFAAMSMQNQATMMFELGEHILNRAYLPRFEPMIREDYPMLDHICELQFGSFCPMPGQMVQVLATGRNHRFDLNHLGLLLKVERLPQPGAPRLYDENGGPAGFLERFVIRRMDGEEFAWTDVQLRPFVTFTDFEENRAFLVRRAEDRAWSAARNTEPEA